jgi:hypothetical protein
VLFSSIQAKVIPATPSTPTLNVLRKRFVPSRFYLCAPRGHGASRSNSAVYSDDHIQRTINYAYQIVANRRPRLPGNGNQDPYPHDYRTLGPNGLAGIDPFAAQSDLLLFPLIPGQLFRAGMDPGPDRVVFNEHTGAFAGVLTHRGEYNNRFHPATPEHENPYLPYSPINAFRRPPPWLDGKFGGLDGGEL